jgi:hypothetical protein
MAKYMSRSERLARIRTRKKARIAFSERFNEALDMAGAPPKYRGRQLAVAKLFQISNRGAKKWMEGESMPALWRIPIIAKTLQVHVEWLLDGKGQKRTVPFPKAMDGRDL